MAKKQRCFVIMPITTPETCLAIYNNNKNHFADVLTGLFTPAISAAGYEVLSPKSSGSNIIQADIIKNLQTCDLVLCDMSTLNPNVFFEFGIRCALNKPVALVVDDKTQPIPFDTSVINYHKYKSIPTWENGAEIGALSKHLSETVKKTPASNAMWRHFGFEDEKSPFSVLNSQEQQVLILVSQGKTNRDIAKAMSKDEGTVRNYVSSILKKLSVKNRAEASSFATEHGLQEYLIKNDN